jgi:hypothetical protein
MPGAVNGDSEGPRCERAATMVSVLNPTNYNEEKWQRSYG